MELSNSFLSFLSLGSEFFFPGGCPVCGSIFTNAAETIRGLCAECSWHFVMEEGERCSVCGRPLISEMNCCLACRETFPDWETTEGRPAYEKLVSIFPYTGRYRELLWAFKYGKSAGAARFFAAGVLTTLETFGLENPVLVPVPPRPGKIRRSGWDQIEFLARVLTGLGKYPVSRCLVRAAGETQKKLNREERLKNLRGNIRAFRKPPRNCVLFDDVITTGSTMAACASALKEAGAEKIYGVCLVYD